MVFGDARQLVGITTEIAVSGPSRAMPEQNRARDHPSLAEKELLFDQRFNLCTESSLQKPGTHDHRSTQSNRSLDRKPSSFEQLTDRRNVLIADVPHHLLAVHGIEDMNMGAGQACRMFARELLHLNSRS